MVACTKVCYQLAIRASSENDPGRGNWCSDGLGGKDDPHHSMKILIDWFTTEGNYARFRGKNNDGVRKQEFATSLAVKLNQETKSTRNAKQVLSKITHVESAFRAAYEFANSETGQGILNDDGVTTFEELVRRKFPYYYDLVEIMGDRSATEPRMTNAHSSLDVFSDVDDDLEDEEIDNCLDNLEEVVTWEGKAGNNSEISPISSEYTSLNNPILSEQATHNTVIKTSEETKAATTESTPVLSRKRSVNDSASKKERKPRKKQSTNKVTPLLDEKTISLFTNSSSEFKTEKMEETVRHNKAMEKAKLEEVAIMSWKGKSDQTNYKMQLIDQYEKLSAKGYSQKKIIRLFPEMKPIAETMEASDSDSSSE
jgi:predicted RNA-binding Zn ribbon-like protein